MRMKFIRTVVVDGRTVQGGAVVDESQIAAGSRRSLIRMGHAEYIADEPEPFAPVVAPAPTPTTNTSNKKK